MTKYDRVQIGLENIVSGAGGGNSSSIIEIIDPSGGILARFFPLTDVPFDGIQIIQNADDLEGFCQRTDHVEEYWFRHSYAPKIEHKLMAALCRLSLPIGLTEEHRGWFEKKIVKNRKLALELLLENDFSEFLYQNTELLLTRNNIEKMAVLAGRLDKIEMQDFLLDYERTKTYKNDHSSPVGSKHPKWPTKKSAKSDSYLEVRNNWGLSGITFPELTLTGYRGEKAQTLIFPLFAGKKTISRVAEKFRLPYPRINIIIPEGYKSISRLAFAWRDLVEVDLPQSLCEIGEKAFWKCENLERISLGSGITSIERSTFLNCISLRQIRIPPTVKVIHSFAFQGCSNLEYVEFSYGLERIGEKAFANCPNLKSIKLPSTIKVVAPNAFYKTGINKIELDVEFVKNFGLFKRALEKNPSLTSKYVKVHTE